MIDTVAKEDKVPDEVDDEPDSDYISVADKADCLDPNEEDIEKLWDEYDPNEAGPICAPKQEDSDAQHLNLIDNLDIEIEDAEGSVRLAESVNYVSNDETGNTIKGQCKGLASQDSLANTQYFSQTSQRDYLRQRLFNHFIRDGSTQDDAQSTTELNLMVAVHSEIHLNALFDLLNTKRQNQIEPQQILMQDALVEVNQQVKSDTP